MESALDTFTEADWVRLTAALNFMETAKPPASSEGFAIRDPLERRTKLFCNKSLAFWRFREASEDEEFVLIEIMGSRLKFVDAWF